MKKRMFVCFFIFTMSVFHLSIPNVVFGQSLARQVFDEYKKLLLRDDIRPLLPTVLEVFKRTEIQETLRPRHIGLILSNPFSLINYDSQIDPQFIGLLGIDKKLRTFFADDQFYKVLDNPSEIGELMNLIVPKPTKLMIHLGNNQIGESDTPLPHSLVVIVHDQHDKTPAGISVSFRVTEGGGSLSGATEIKVETDEMGKAQATLTLGSDPGENQVEVRVDGFPLLTQTFTAAATTTAVCEVPDPDEPISKFDVNSDGVVNIIDLSLVISLNGTSGKSVEGVDADINEDGIVDGVDSILVASALGLTAAAPSVRALVQGGISAGDVQVLLTQAKALPETAQADPAYQRGIVVLEQLLVALRKAEIVPKQTTLLLNYPNPFNPETWIPYQLAEAADVTVTIYSMNGTLIRTLALGHRHAGLYQRKNRAAYWDGRNESGERVASGLYFYTLTADDFTATRKMLIRK